MTLMGASSLFAQSFLTPEANKGTGKASWMDEAKYGMFIHWGAYSSLANGEWVMNRTKIPVAEYKEMASHFNPVDFDAEHWIFSG